MHFKISSAICFDLDLSRILSSANGLNDDVLGIIQEYTLKPLYLLTAPILSTISFQATAIESSVAERADYDQTTHKMQADPRIYTIRYL